ncbi:MAG: UPF0175 family protein [Ginsengibacter sp.]
MLVIDDEFINASAMSPEDLKLEFAIWLYEKDKISMRKAARMVGLNWLDFSNVLSVRNIPTIKMTQEDFKIEVETVNSLH